MKFQERLIVMINIDSVGKVLIILWLKILLYSIN